MSEPNNDSGDESFDIRQGPALTKPDSFITPQVDQRKASSGGEATSYFFHRAMLFAIRFAGDVNWSTTPSYPTALIATRRIQHPSSNVVPPLQIQ